MQYASYTFDLINIPIIFESTFLIETLCSESLEISFLKIKKAKL